VVSSLFKAPAGFYPGGAERDRRRKGDTKAVILSAGKDLILLVAPFASKNEPDINWPPATT